MAKVINKMKHSFNCDSNRGLMKNSKKRKL